MYRGTAALVIAMLFAGPAGMRAQQPQKKTEPAHKVIELSGCLGRAHPESTFTLTNATTVSRTTPDQVSPSSRVGPAGNKRLPEIEYELAPASGVDPGVDAKELGRHIGQRVEITARPSMTRRLRCRNRGRLSRNSQSREILQLRFA